MRTTLAERNGTGAGLRLRSGTGVATAAAPPAPQWRAITLPAAISLALHAAALVLIALQPPRPAPIGPAQPVIAVLQLSHWRTLPGVGIPTPERLLSAAGQAPIAAPVATGIVDPSPPPPLPATASAEPKVATEAVADPAPPDWSSGGSPLPGPATRPLWRSTDRAALATQTDAALSAQAQVAQFEGSRRQAEPAMLAGYEAAVRSLLALHPALGECRVDIAAPMAPTAACSDAVDTAFLQTRLDQIGAAPPVAGRWQIQLAAAPVIER
jgi:hypothetical protein